MLGTPYEHITTASALARFCDGLADAPTLAFDTEFVSEDSYRPELCLVQVAAAGRLAVIDPLTIPDLTPLWERVAAPGHTTVVHAGREEFCFCVHAIGRRPQQLFDTQLAAGLIGLEYPAAYSTLVARLLHKSLGKGETRTEWRRRPLSNRQIEYALQDVLYLDELRRVLLETIARLQRGAWLEAELQSWQTQLETAEFGERWRRMPGLAGMSAQSLAIARQLWTWRDGEARRQNRPPRRVLRDDLVVELAKRGTADPQRVHAVRGLERRDKQKHLPAIAACIQQALELPPEAWPRPLERASHRPQLTLLAQFLAAALSSVCRAQRVAPSLVGTVQDVRDLIAHQLGLDETSGGDLPALACGWRAEVVGQTLEDLLAGKLSFYIADPLGDQPLDFEPRGGHA